MTLKDTFITKAEEQIQEWQAELDRLKARAGQMESETKVTYHDTLSKLKDKQRDAEQKLLELKEAGHENFETLKERYEKARQEMEESLEEARTPFML